MKKQNLYELIGVQSDASQPEIEAACREILEGGADQATKVAVRYARDTLCSPVHRTAYDTSVKPGNTPAISWDEPASGAIGSRSKFFWLLVIATPFLIWTYYKHVKPALPAKPPSAIAPQQPVSGLEVTSQPIATAPSTHSVQSNRPRTLTAIPYYTWANRGNYEMQVWLPGSAADL